MDGCDSPEKRASVGRGGSVLRWPGTLVPLFGGTCLQAVPPGLPHPKWTQTLGCFKSFSLEGAEGSFPFFSFSWTENALTELTLLLLVTKGSVDVCPWTNAGSGTLTPHPGGRTWKTFKASHGKLCASLALASGFLPVTIVMGPVGRGDGWARGSWTFGAPCVAWPDSPTTCQ